MKRPTLKDVDATGIHVPMVVWHEGSSFPFPFPPNGEIKTVTADPDAYIAIFTTDGTEPEDDHVRVAFQTYGDGTGMLDGWPALKIQPGNGEYAMTKQEAEDMIATCDQVLLTSDEALWSAPPRTKKPRTKGGQPKGAGTTSKN